MTRDQAPTSAVTLTPLFGFPEVREGDEIADIMVNVLQDNGIELMDGDILVVSSKLASKTMGLRAPAGGQAEAVLSQTVRIVAERMTASGITRLVESVAGPVLTAAGVDASNTADNSIVLILPADPDAVAARLRDQVRSGWAILTGAHVAIGVILSDTAGRPWRIGQTDFALGAAGVHVLDDLRGSADANGRILSVTQRSVADEIAAAADLVKGKTTGVPAAHLRGLGQYVRDGEAPDVRDSEAPDVRDGESLAGAGDLVRTGQQDWFAYGAAEAVRAALGVEPGSAAAAQVGIPAIWPEDVATRAGRALRVALLTCPEASGQVDGDTVRLSAPDDFELGVATTRAEVALHGEGLRTTLTRSPAMKQTASTAAAKVDAARRHPSVIIVLE